MEVRFAAEADEDIDRAWYALETSRPGEGTRFHEDIRSTLDYIELWPRGFQVRYRYYRFAPLAVFRYHIIYSIDGEYIVVHCVRHMHQRPLKRYFGPGSQLWSTLNAMDPKTLIIKRVMTHAEYDQLDMNDIHYEG